jgi:hypothetical protein
MSRAPARSHGDAGEDEIPRPTGVFDEELAVLSHPAGVCGSIGHDGIGDEPPDDHVEVALHDALRVFVGAGGVDAGSQRSKLAAARRARHRVVPFGRREHQVVGIAQILGPPARLCQITRPEAEILRDKSRSREC